MTTNDRMYSPRKNAYRPTSINPHLLDAIGQGEPIFCSFDDKRMLQVLDSTFDVIRACRGSDEMIENKSTMERKENWKIVLSLKDGERIDNTTDYKKVMKEKKSLFGFGDWGNIDGIGLFVCPSCLNSVFIVFYHE